jgi:hypothetical protein
MMQNLAMLQTMVKQPQTLEWTLKVESLKVVN